MIKSLYPLLLAATAAAAAPDTPPNVLLIFVDDLGYHDLGCQGATDIRTPEIDKLAASGARCTAGYVTAPQCSPSRAGLLTGMSQARFGFNTISDQSGLPPRDVVELLPEQIKNLGYATAMIGKWHVGESVEGKGWDYFPGSAPWERGFDLCVLLNGGGSHYLPYSPQGKKFMARSNNPYWLAEKAAGDGEIRPLKDLPADTYLTEYFSTRASGFIRENREKPWFLYLAYNAPHGPLTPLLADRDANSAIEDPLRRNFAAIMTGLDRELGKVLATLDETGQRERTLVWFISDNGGPTHVNASRNDPFPGHKGDLWDGGIRVPFLVSWPGRIPAGRTFDPMISTLDVLPTSLAAAGKKDIASIHEGKNILPQLTGETPGEAHDALFWNWRERSAARVGMLKENRNGQATGVGKRGAPDLPYHMFNDFAANPMENPRKPLTDEARMATVKSALDAWLEQLRADAARLTPDHKSAPRGGRNAAD